MRSAKPSKHSRAPTVRPVLVYDLAIRAPPCCCGQSTRAAAMVGAIMVIMDARVIKQDARGALKMMTPKLQRALADFADMRPDSEPAPSRHVRPAPAAKAPALQV